MTVTAWLTAIIRARADDRGEGVISTAIAVLVMASIGALMWFGFQQLWASTEARTTTQVEQIGS
ncbi:MAG: hypothetical protein JJU45_19175 [Acidimicrobiia bacterium]|nr:hypothetical protein [Acidimicrobiia bacterium]